MVSEVLTFRDGAIVEGHGTYRLADSQRVLELIAAHFKLDPRWLQVEFGFIDEDELRSKPRPKASPAKG